MSFGRDPNVLSSIPSFRQQQQMFRKPTTSTYNNFNEKLVLKAGETESVRILKALYQVESYSPDGVSKPVSIFYPYMQHYDARTNRYFICANIFGTPFEETTDKCRGCQRMLEERALPKAQKTMSRTDRAGFTVLHYSYYALMDELNSKGEPKVNNKGEIRKMWQPITRMAAQRMQSKEDVKYGHVVPWSVSVRQLADFSKDVDEIESSCMCGAEERLVLTDYACKSCGEVVQIPSHLTDDEVIALRFTEFTCECGAVGIPDEILECTCNNPVRASIFDVDINLKGIANQSGKGVFPTITSFTKPKEIESKYIEIAKPLELERIFGPASVSYQESCMGATTNQVSNETRAYKPRFSVR